MHRTVFQLGWAVLLLTVGCSEGGVSSPEQARQAYLGIDPSIDKAIKLGFDGFNAAGSANIAPQTAMGAKTGTLTVTGQVDQGASANKGMRLLTQYTMYSDDMTAAALTYDTPSTTLPHLDMQLKMIPTGSLDGSFVGEVVMSGELKGTVTLNLAFMGTLRAGAGNTVERSPGTTHITGTATSPYGTYTVDITR